MDDTTIQDRRLPDYLAHRLKILFVGYNPGLTSAAEGHHFAGNNNHFYRLVRDSCLTPRLYSPLEDALLVALGYGVTNIVDRPSSSSGDLSEAELRGGALALRQKIAFYRPGVACFLGKSIYRAYAGLSGSVAIDYGIQERPVLPPTVDFVAPNPSSRSTVPYASRLRWFELLRALAHAAPASSPAISSPPRA